MRTDENLLLATYPKGFANIILQPQWGGSNSWADERANRWPRGVGRGSDGDGSSAATAHKHVQHVMQLAYVPYSTSPPNTLHAAALCALWNVCVRSCVCALHGRAYGRQN